MSFSLAGGTETYFQYHRWITHAIVSAPADGVGACARCIGDLAAVASFLGAWVQAWLAALIAVASHLLLDSTNPYGIRLFLPFSRIGLAWTLRM